MKSFYLLTLAAAVALAACSNDDSTPRSQSEPRGYRTRHRTDRVHARCPGQPLCNPHLLRFGRLDAHRHRRRRGLADRHARKRHGRQPDRRTGGPKEFRRGGTHSPSRNLLRQATRAGNRHPAHDRHHGFHRPVRPVVRPRIAGDGPYLRCGKDLATGYGISGQCDQAGRFERVYRTLDLPARDRVFRVAAKTGLLRYGPDRAGYPQSSVTDRVALQLGSDHLAGCQRMYGIEDAHLLQQ